MELSVRIFLATLLAVVIGSPPYGHAQTAAQKDTGKTAAPSEADAQKKNMQSYIDLLARMFATRRLKSWAR